MGGESTRPGAEPVPEREELKRVLPVIEALAKACELPLSVDTRRARVAEAALARGARVVNAVAGLRDPELAAVCAAHGATPGAEPHARRARDHAARGELHRRGSRGRRRAAAPQAEAAERAGVARERIWLDPGIGFGKRARAHSVVLLARLGELVARGYPVLVGPSRKSFLGELTGAPVEERLAGSLAAATACVLAGARAVRMHDVAEARQAVDVAAAIRDARAEAP